MCPPDAPDPAGREHDQLAGTGPAAVRERGVAARPFPSSRRLVTAAVRAGRRIVPMHGLFEVDITTARRLLAENDPPLSLTAFVVASLGRAAATTRRCTPTATGVAGWSSTATSTCRP